MKITNLLLVAAVSGIMAGASSVAYGEEGSKPAATTADAAAADKHGCKGANACKGKGGCKTDKSDCAGKNDCKGKGGCATAKHDCKAKNDCKGQGKGAKNECKAKGECKTAMATEVKK